MNNSAHFELIFSFIILTINFNFKIFKILSQAYERKLNCF